MVMFARASLVLVTLMIPSLVAAETHREARAHDSVGFLQINGGYGLQIGTTPYVPQEDGSFDHPLTNGFAVGASAGINLSRGVAFLISYDFTSAHSRSGQIANAVDDIDGEISYHSIVGGLRITRDCGAGWFFGHLGVGVVLPFETKVTYLYDPALATLPTPITGEGTRTAHFGVAYGAQAGLGYAIPLSRGVYLGVMLKLKAFETTNEDKETELRNFVTDFRATPPVATTVIIEHGGGVTPPNTYSVQDVRAHLAVGYNF